MKYVLPLALVFSLAGCGPDPEEPICTLELRRSILVIVNDSTTNGPVLSGDIEVVATDAAFSDTIRGSITPIRYNRPWSVVDERAGNYTVEVSVTGYHPWSMSGVVVQMGICHVEARTLTAKLQPSS